MTSWILSFSNSSKLLYNTSSSCRSLFVRQLGDFLLSWNSSHMRLKGHSFVDSLYSIWLFSVSFILLLFHFLFHSFHSFSFDCQLGIVFQNINAKIANSAKKNPLNGLENALPVSICPNVTGAYMLSRSFFNTDIPLHSQCFPGNLLASETNLNLLQCSSVDILISWRLLCIKAGQRLCMVFQYLLWQLVYRFTVPRNILQRDLMLWDQQFEEMLCEIFVNMSQ